MYLSHLSLFVLSLRFGIWRQAHNSFRQQSSFEIVHDKAATAATAATVKSGVLRIEELRLNEELIGTVLKCQLYSIVFNCVSCSVSELRDPLEIQKNPLDVDVDVRDVRDVCVRSCQDEKGDAFHFVCYICHEGKVYELDGQSLRILRILRAGHHHATARQQDSTTAL